MVETERNRAIQKFARCNEILSPVNESNGLNMNEVELLKAIQIKIYRDTLTHEQADQIAEDVFELIGPLMVNHFERASLENGEKKRSSSQREFVKEPTEAMCDRARGFIMGLDLGYRTWEEMDTHLDLGGYPSLWSISDRAQIDPQGHITKWDVAQCIYLLMNGDHLDLKQA